MRFVKANGLVIHYLDQGRRDGPPLVFINSLGTDFRIWNEVAEILAPDFRIVTYDKRGHGLSEPGPDKNDMADYARDLAALLDQVGVGRATICRIVHRRPDRPGALLSKSGARRGARPLRHCGENRNG
jgi:3-oxoadipate enol-lactonase